MENYLLLIVGILLSVLGAVNIKGNIRTIHAYNRRNVREEDIPKYGRAVGTGETYVVPASLVVTCIGYQTSPIPDVPFDVVGGLEAGSRFVEAVRVAPSISVTSRSPTRSSST